MVRKGFRTLPQDLDQVLDSHGLRHQFEALSNEAKVMYLSWIGEVPELRKRRIALLVRSLRRHSV